jgi:hypothetical protein
MPSYFESLSMVALEAWALGRPVLANARCDVLKGQSVRSNAGLYYASQDEFVEALGAIEHNRWIAAALGRNGRRFFREHYDWSVIERKYLEMLARLSAEGSGSAPEALPGWFDRRRRTCPPAEEVVANLPIGAASLSDDDRTGAAAPDPSAARPSDHQRDRRMWNRSRNARHHRPHRGQSRAGGRS